MPVRKRVFRERGRNIGEKIKERETKRNSSCVDVPISLIRSRMSDVRGRK